MVRERAFENPFRPGQGTLPPVLAGRDAELAAADRDLETLKAGRSPSQDILFFGPRGNGKTALLWHVAERARKLGLRTERLPASECSDKTSLIEELRQRTGGGTPRLTGASVAGPGVTTEPAMRSGNVCELLARWIGDAPLVLVLDEVHAVSPEAGRAFFDAVQNARSASLPFLLLAAGTPETPRRLRRMGTHTERGFRRFRIGRLTPDDTRTALAGPAETHGLPMTPEALGLLAAEAQDYPYFIQLLGSSAWDAGRRRGETGISRQAAGEGAAETRRTIEDFYADRSREAIEHGLDDALCPIAAAIRERGGRLGHSEVKALLRRVAAEAAPAARWNELLDSLEDLGVIWERAPGVWEMGIPSFADHLLRRHEPG